MVNQQSVDEIVAAGKARKGSSTLMAALQSPPASNRTSVEQQLATESEQHNEHLNRPVTPNCGTFATEIGEDLSLSNGRFSEAPTLLTRVSNFTENTGGRAPRSWRGGMANFWNPPSTFLSNDTSQSDLSMTNQDSAASSTTDVPQIETPLVEEAAGPVTRPDEPRSFFDSDSESEGETILRSASRASGLHGQRAKLVEHNSSDASPGRTRFYQSSLLAPPRNAGPSHSKAEQISGTKLKNLVDLTPAVENSNPLAPFRGGAAAALNALMANEVEKASTTALAPSTPSLPRSFDSSEVIEVPDTPTRAEALDTLPSPHGGFGTLQLRRPSSSGFVISPLDALQSNPVTRLDTTGLQRATSAPPLPYRRNRKVTIRPVDIGIIHTAHQKKLFRDSVVSTPYPPRHHSIAVADHIQTPTSTRKTSNAVSPTNEKTSSRSPSVSQITPPEILVVELSLAKHPLATKTITIPIYDRGTFDDRALFSIFRNTYNHTLLGFTLRFLTARTLSNATFVFPPISTTTPTGELIPFDAPSFLLHLQHPASGHKRKTWLQWLRKHQPHPPPPPTTSSRLRSGSHTSDPYFSADGVPRTPAFVDPRPPPPPPPASDPSSPATSHVSPTSAPAAPFSGPPGVVMVVPKVILDHTFSLPRIAAAVSLVLTLTALATLLWVLFGTPGVSAADAHASEMMGVMTGAVDGARDWDWKIDAQKRVLTALVMGVLAFLMGACGVSAWVGGSWVAL